MTREEFNTVANELGMKKSRIRTVCKKDNKIAYTDSNLDFYYSNSSYVIVKGRIPFEVANNIYKKYPNNEYGIRVEGQAISEIPFDWAIDDQFKADLDDIEYDDNGDCKDIVKVNEALSNLRKRAGANKYINCYQIDTTRGLIIFVNEMRNYVARNKCLPGNEFDYNKRKAPTRILKLV